ncbi:serine hydrolase [Saccharopolyspora griseoalba]|uniref:Serine hydrolase n=1 Tax=Saccharopolyspora griseoalba TaxID=1431848 RepID=A0ABW2LPC1_9PSEU
MRAPSEEPVRVSPSRAPAAVAAVERWSGAHARAAVGVAVLDRRTGDLVVGSAGSEPMYAASLTKLVLVVDVLERGLDGARVRELVRRMLGPSDDAAMNELWSRFGGQDAVRRVAARLELHDTRPPERPGWWGEAATSARDVAVVYRHVLTSVDAADRRLILGSLNAAPERAADGFDQNIGLMRVGGRAVKTAWACCSEGRVWTHSAGLWEQRYAVALLLGEPSSSGYGRAGADLTAAAEVAARALR